MVWLERFCEGTSKLRALEPDNTALSLCFTSSVALLASVARVAPKTTSFLRNTPRLFEQRDRPVHHGRATALKIHHSICPNGKRRATCCKMSTNGMNSTPSNFQGTSVRVRRERVVDGDTIRAYPPAHSRAESLRILNLDTEESFKFGSKPVTPWGKAAKKYASDFFRDQKEVIIEFPGTEPVEECLVKYRGTFGRLLVWVHRVDGVDFTERMIRLGYSPYYNKYGNAEFESHHRRYILAERDAQMAERGVWDQVKVNGRVIRNYPSLCTWWSLRADIIDRYRAARKSGVLVYNTRKDFPILQVEAEKETTVTVFTEVRNIRRTSSEDGSIAAVASIGNDDRPVQIYVPDASSKEGEQILELFRTRYMGTSRVPRRGYCYLRGTLNTAGDGVRLTVERPFDVMDELWMADEVYAVSKDVEEIESRGTEDKTIGGKRTADSVDGPAPKKKKVMSGAGLARISALLPNPVGRDSGNETVTVMATGSDVDLSGWALIDKAGRRFSLDGTVTKAGKEFKLSGGVRLTNTGTTVKLLDGAGVGVHEVSYKKEDVEEGQEIVFR
ncbi:ribonucleate (deoxynucleate) 3'-nucleotidohydrolase [Gracilaria domingensis]|nr:ribonucleate (deoxynucleate) 3'-nucleotidohydrolase [Gracilaria domingensis]